MQLCGEVTDLLSRLGEAPETFTGIKFFILLVSIFNDISCDKKDNLTLSTAVSPVLFDVLTFNIYAACLRLSIHRSDRHFNLSLNFSNVHGHMTLVNHLFSDICSDSTHEFRVRVGAFDVSICHLCFHHPLSAATLTESWTHSLCLALCSATRSSQSMMNRCNSAIDFALDGAMMLAMEAAPSTADFGRYPVQLLPRSEIRSQECLQHSTNKRTNFACGRGDQG